MSLSTAKRRLDAIQPDWRRTLPPGWNADDVLAHFVNAYRTARADQPGLTVETFFANIRKFI